MLKFIFQLRKRNDMLASTCIQNKLLYSYCRWFITVIIMLVIIMIIFLIFYFQLVTFQKIGHANTLNCKLVFCPWPILYEYTIQYRWSHIMAIFIWPKSNLWLFIGIIFCMVVIAISLLPIEWEEAMYVYIS